jgi:N-dimethylarginine dimethylaminohydrolase
MVKNEGDRLTRVVVCTPREQYFHVGDYDAHNIRERVDPARTKFQHDGLKAILRRSGCEVIDVPELPEHPNSVFTRDAALCTPAGYIQFKMGLGSRRGEDVWMAGILSSLSAHISCHPQSGWYDEEPPRGPFDGEHEPVWKPPFDAISEPRA